MKANLYHSQSKQQDEAQYVAVGRYLNTLFHWLPILILLAGLVVASLSSTWLLGSRPKDFTNPLLKFWPLLLALSAFVLRIFSLRANRVAAIILLSVRTNKFLTGFTLLSLPGAIYARFLLGQPTSYFSQAIMLLSFFFIYFVLASIPSTRWPQVRKWMRRILTIVTIIAGLAIISNLLDGFSKTKPDTVLILTQGIALYRFWGFGLFWVVQYFIISLLTLLTFKNTAILILIIVSLGVYIFPKNRLRRVSVLTGVLIVVTTSLLLGFVYAGYQALDNQFSDGHTDFRQLLYETRLAEFQDSPIYGSLFTGGTSVLWERDNLYVPTHSDVMDVVAQGGLTGIVLFVGAFGSLFFSLLRCRSKWMRHDPQAANLATWLFLFLIATVISFSLNSTLGSPDIAFIIWFLFAFAHRHVQVTAVHNNHPNHE